MLVGTSTFPGTSAGKTFPLSNHLVKTDSFLPFTITRQPYKTLSQLFILISRLRLKSWFSLFYLSLEEVTRDLRDFWSLILACCLDTPLSSARPWLRQGDTGGHLERKHVSEGMMLPILRLGNHSGFFPAPHPIPRATDQLKMPLYHQPESTSPMLLLKFYAL